MATRGLRPISTGSAARRPGGVARILAPKPPFTGFQTSPIENGTRIVRWGASLVSLPARSVAQQGNGARNRLAGHRSSGRGTRREEFGRRGYGRRSSDIASDAAERTGIQTCTGRQFASGDRTPATSCRKVRAPGYVCISGASDWHADGAELIETADRRDLPCAANRSGTRKSSSPCRRRGRAASVQKVRDGA